MSAPDESDGGGGIPEWVVTFGDMMSLLLTFFIMLVSLSEVKQKEKYQALVDSIRQRFGHESSTVSFVPGRAKPRNAPMANLATMGRARRLDTHRGGDKTKAPVGDHSRVRIIRPGTVTAVGTAVTFPVGSAKLEEEQRRDLAVQAREFLGKPQKIEIRGHTSLQPAPGKSDYRDHWELAYQRCRATMKFLVEQGIKSERLRLSVAGSSEPVYTGTDPDELSRNSRVEVYLLDEIVLEPQKSSPAPLDGLPADPSVDPTPSVPPGPKETAPLKGGQPVSGAG